MEESMSLMKTNDLVLLYTPIDTREHAKKLATVLVEEHLIACANIFAIDSVYRWKGEILDGSEFVLIAKTLPGAEARARAMIEEMHPYDVPCILSFPADANASFAAWVGSEVLR